MWTEYVYKSQAVLQKGNIYIIGPQTLKCAYNERFLIISGTAPESKDFLN